MGQAVSRKLGLMVGLLGSKNGLLSGWKEQVGKRDDRKEL